MTRKSLLMAVPVTVLAFLLLAQVALAQCRVEGTVVSADGMPIAGATVTLQGPDTDKPLTTSTDAEGRYAFENVKAGIRARIVAMRGSQRVAVTYPLVSLWVERVDLKERLLPAVPRSTEDVLAQDGVAGTVGGFVRLANGAAVPAARVIIESTTLATWTDSAGRFVFSGLRPGVHIGLQAFATGFEPARRDFEVASGETNDVDVTIAPASADAQGDDEQALGPSSDLLAQPDGSGPAHVPAVGAADPIRALQTRPGVAASLEDAESLLVRGGATGETEVLWDGRHLYQFDHAFGRLAGYDGRAVRDVTFSPSALSAGEGGWLAGTLRLTGESNPARRPTGLAEFSLLGVGARVAVPLGDRLSVQLATRRSPTSIYDEALDLFGPVSGVSVRDRSSRLDRSAAAPRSSFYDVNGKFDLAVGRADSVAVSFYDGRDIVNNSRDLPNGSVSGSIAAVSGFQPQPDALVQVTDLNRWTTTGFSGVWTRQWARGVSTTLSVGRSEYETSGERSWLLTSASAGAGYTDAALRGGSYGILETNELVDITSKLDGAFQLGFDHAITFGGQISSLDVTYDATTEVWGGVGRAATMANLLDRHSSDRVISAYGQDLWRPAARLTISPGARIAHYALSGATYLDPRVSAGYQLTPLFRVTGGWAVNHQAINRIVREDRTHGDGAFWDLSDGSVVPVATANQVTAGGIVESPGVRFEFEGFYKRLDDLTMVAPRLYPGVLPAGVSDALFHNGSGTARGVELRVQCAVPRNGLWAGYTLSDSEYRFPTLEASAFPAPLDQRHEFKVGDTIVLASDWTLTGTLVAASGRPNTPATGVEAVWFPTGRAVNQVAFGAKNSGRLAPYHRLDLSTQRTFRFGRLQTDLGVTVFNVYDRDNIWNFDYEAAGDSLTVNDVLLMGRAVNVFVKVGY